MIPRPPRLAMRLLSMRLSADWRDYLEDLRLIFSTTLFALFTAFFIAYGVLGLWELLSPLFK